MKQLMEDENLGESACEENRLKPVLIAKQHRRVQFLGLPDLVMYQVRFRFFHARLLSSLIDCHLNNR